MECKICYELYDEQYHYPYIINCGHTFCRLCIEKLLNEENEGNTENNEIHKKCPICRTSINTSIKNYDLVTSIRKINNFNTNNNAFDYDMDNIIDRLTNCTNNTHSINLCTSRLSLYMTINKYNVLGKNGLTPLMETIINNKPMKEILEYAQISDCNITNNDDKSALIIFIDNYDKISDQPYIIDVLTYLIENTDCNIKDENGCTALMYAVFKKIPVIFIKLLINNSDCNNINLLGNTVLMMNIMLNNNEEINDILIPKTDCNIQNREGMCALMIAITHYSPSKITVKKLLPHTNYNIKSNDNITALMYSILCINEMDDIIIRTLLENSDCAVKDNKGLNALMYAARLGETNIVQMLLEKENYSVQCNTTDNNGFTPLMHAVICDEFIDNKNDIKNIVKIVKMIAMKSDCNIKNPNGKTALILATYKNLCDVLDIAKILVEYTNIEIADNKGWTAVMYAVYNKNYDLAKYLLEFL